MEIVKDLSHKPTAAYQNWRKLVNVLGHIVIIFVVVRDENIAMRQINRNGYGHKDLQIVLVLTTQFKENCQEYDSLHQIPNLWETRRQHWPMLSKKY